MKTPVTLVLLGDIAAGKGTQAKILAIRYGLKLIDTGAFSRRILTGKSKVSERLARVKLGKLAPSDIIQRYLRRSLRSLQLQQGVLVDGGKMPAEARLIYQIFRKQGRRVLVIYLHIPRSEIFLRLNFRYYCSRTGEPLVIKRASIKRCPKCAAKIIKRADDDPQAIRNRIAYYDKIYSKTVKFWRRKKVLRVIDGRPAIPAVTQEIVKTIREYYR